MRAVLDRAAMRRGWAFVLFVLGAVVASRADEPEMRTWKDASGRFKIQAKYAGMNGANVMLKKADGSQMQVDLEKLCSADRQYVEAQQKKLAEEDPFKPVPAEPAKKAATPAPRPSAMARPGARSTPFGRPAAPSPFDGTPPPDDGTPEVQPDWSAAALPEMPPDGPWKLAIGPAPAAPEGSRPRAVPIPPRADFFEKREGFLVNAPGTHALAGFAMDNPKPGTSRVVLCDLRSGKLLGQGRSEGVMVPLDLSDSGDRLLVRNEEFGFGNSGRLELWNLTAEALEKAWRFEPYGDLDKNDRNIQWAKFLGTGRFATIGGKGKLVVWDLDPVQPRTTITVDDGCIPGISPDGKFLAFVEKGKLGVLEVDAGRVAALQPMPVTHSAWPALGFSPSGKRLACVSAGKLYAWNTEDGSLHRDILLAPVAVQAGSPPIWTDDDHVLVGDRFIIDVDSQVKLWQYDGGETVVGDRTGLCWFLLHAPHNQPSAVVPARIPQPAAVHALKQALADPDYFVLRPGAAVTIDVNGIPDASQRPKVVESLTARLAQVQAKVAAGSPLVLSAAMAQGKEEDVSYRTMGAGFRTDNFKVRPHISSVKLTYQGQVAWESAASTLPFVDFAHLGPNESLADHVKKFEKPNYDFFAHVEVPRLVARPKPGANTFTLGTSQISATGVR